MVMVTFANAMNAVQQISPICPSSHACLDRYWHCVDLKSKQTANINFPCGYDQTVLI